jgi:hypothetical protein
MLVQVLLLAYRVMSLEKSADQKSGDPQLFAGEAAAQCTL